LVNEQAHDTRITGIDHLVRPGYSWWTLGYILTLEGAKKLLAPKPLERFVPVDEYIPIMFGEHPECVHHTIDYFVDEIAVPSSILSSCKLLEVLPSLIQCYYGWKPKLNFFTG
jgi:hypothetical protein